MRSIHKVLSLVSMTVLFAIHPAVQAAVGLDRTRAIFNADSKSITLNISNENKQLPYLAQVWLEGEHQQKLVQGPLVVTPPVQRLEPGMKSMIRVSSTPDANQLPQDRESLFYFNLREIPPRSDQPNVLQIALQTKIKLFYRPKGIVTTPGAVWQDQLILHEEGSGYRIENPTPYYVTVIGLAGSQRQSEDEAFDVVMVSPKSSTQVKVGHYTTPYLTYINDYGGRPVLKFSCRGGNCAVKKV
ncbi:fimbrial biogenesis chaperone [Yersinia bercovieri]|uniref:fimbrial biogenesis chaperone n=1 Tax=Yersinia bercovieri TaxID=634 RepID=UPI0005E9547D|nr:fimbria/pilus periplasmic chaperone [Yersinia bercovieri]MDN0101380.1 fimbria/pilus periplasmic chaperone [Yersinia bercovieri]CNI53733.1 fimbrial chaperone protein [Yersinia bercovieri]